MKILKVNKGVIDWESEELQLVPEFKQLYLSDLSLSKGVASSYFTYIYFIGDYRSPYISLEDDEREEKARYEAAIPQNADIPYEVTMALNKYIALQETPSIRLLKGVKQGLDLSSRAIELITKKMSTTFNVLENYTEEELKDPDTLARYNTMLENINKNIDTILLKAGKVSTILEQHKQIEDTVKKEQSEVSMLSGGRRKGNRMDPD
jgi:hypothetical protein